MNFIKKIFDGKAEGDNLTHLQFQKFSRGEFQNRAMISAKHSGKNYTIGTTAEFANELVRVAAEALGQGKAMVKGAVVSTSDLREELNPKDVKQFQGVKRYIIEREMSGNEIIVLLDEFPTTFFALTFSVPSADIDLKIKPKAPKSGKPSNKDEDGVKADFCKLKTQDIRIANSFVFEAQEWKKAEIKHTFFIDQIIIPDHLKSEKDFAKVREGALRKGRVLREATIDGKPIKSEKEFLA